MKNVSLLLLILVLLLVSPLLFSAAVMVQPTQSATTGYQPAPQPEPSVTAGVQFADNLKLIKLLKEQQSLLINANTHLMKLYQYLEKRAPVVA
ncbi:MAG: hypothetical protein M1549_02425 [Candidatus Dependentiae bacterium]|nr:hypothetical protein [Candidatus Dependentiae bacterium]